MIKSRVTKRWNEGIRLGVNIDHCATLRQVRGGVTPYPNLIECAEWVLQGGGDLITIHLREDRRHIQDHDLFQLVRWRKLPINLELAPQKTMLKIALQAKPDWICFVPEKRRELTTEGGLNLKECQSFFKKHLPLIRSHNIFVSLFIGADLEQVRMSAELGVDAVEFHTGHWVLARGKKKEQEWKALKQAARLAHQLGLSVHAGHGLDYQHAERIRKLPFLEEVNIGHSLVCYALEYGLKEAVRRMTLILSGS
ncbi:MAG: pyridoxine 5'-phosphate synthase [Bdellovibrionaceae bacterium]|nr:pyridoxine 5'-phosphate synthase [Pseudobdellovibrionaceae bacterium]MDW8190151.1 pyridoxine 5'-phosphate synthase [Pseudobdellovibrionaceae bacterium]